MIKRKNFVRTAVAASLMALAGAAFAQEDNSNSATDPTYYGSWYYWNPLVTAPGDVEVYTYRDYWTPRWYLYGPRATYHGPGYYDRWAYYDTPSNPSWSASASLGTQPGYMGPRDVTR